MTDKQFRKWNLIGAALAFVVSAVTYLSTIEPSASFWDCGEFIASSYKLEVGHPPGNPTFQLFARLFTFFGEGEGAAVAVNAMSAICSALTIFFLYLTIVWFAGRLVRRREGGEYSDGQAIAIIGSGLVGALVYCFSDTFWFSAVEGEVYAMSSLFTAAVFWAMTRWYDLADEPHSGRWIVLIAFLMGLSIGVHLLNLLAIPALVFMFYYRRREDRPFSFVEMLKIFAIGVIILALILFVIIPILPKAAAYVDLFFVNSLGLPYNSGAAFFLIAVLVLCFWGILATLKKQKVFWNTALLCLTTIIIGFSIFSLDIIRSSAKTPTNEYQPDNAFTLVRYLSREQYGSSPLVYGQYYGAPWDLKQTKYWAPLGGKYKKVDAPIQATYPTEAKMLFPRMWSDGGGDGRYEAFYKVYTGGKGRKLRGARAPKPTMGANLAYFFDYQLNWMYWRYFMWNFVGRQNEIHSPTPGNIFYGNWESGVGFIDRWRLGDQRDAPGVLADNAGKNHYFFLPLLLGLLGLCFQFGRDKRGSWLNFLMFFMTGIAIVIYLNQPPYQVRERDYAYAGSFYFFSVWCGLAVLALYEWVEERMAARSASGQAPAYAALALSVLCLCVPVLMAGQNWDDHDRSGRKTAAEIGYNYLNSAGPQGILVTHGDNDTFPLWYDQEVEGVRPDVRVVNTSLLGTDWHIDQMKWACNESKPLPLAVGPEQYLYGTNEYIYIVDNRNAVMPISDVMTLFRHPQVKVSLGSGRKADYIASRKIAVPVNKENCLKYGIVEEKYASQIPDSIVLEIPAGKDYLDKPELFMLDLLSNYQWDRPLNLLNLGGDIKMGIKDYLEFQGYSYKFIPIKNRPSSGDPGFVETDELYRLMTQVYKWDALSADDWFVDYQNCYTFMGVMSIRGMFSTCAKAFMKAGEKERAMEMLDKCAEVMHRFPLCATPIGFSGNDYMVIQMVDQYYKLGAPDKARALAESFGAELMSAIGFYLQFYEYARDDFESAVNYLYFLTDTLEAAGDKEIADSFSKTLHDMVRGAVPAKG
ncbi:MAG: DUF2723 domain-containing protein [Bacteroidales bacterium]|nr:DUF2723 domain-containing protein [Bacteroidales bacterium]